MAGAITLTPNHGPVGASILITGTGFTAGDTMSFTFGGAPIVPTEAPIVVAGDGTLPTCHIVIPASIQGTHAIVATDAHAVSGSANFTTDPALSLSPTSGRIGSTTVVTATGLAASSAVTIDFAGSNVTPGGSPISDANGNYSGTITIPTKAAGARTVTVTDAALNAPTTSFTVSAPTLVLTPNHGPVGTVVTITGDNYIPTHALTVTNIDSGTTTPTSNSSGSIPASTTITIQSKEKGSHNVTCGDGTNTATAAFTVEQQITIDPTYGPAGAEVVVTGTGFAPSVGITFTLNGSAITPTSPVTSSDHGAFTATIDLPANLSNGLNPIVATDASTNSASVSYDVSNTVPFTLVPDKNNSYEYIEDMALDVTDSSMVDQLVIDCKINRKELLINLYVDGSNGVTFSTFGIIHESDNNIPPTDPTTGIKKWTALDANVAVASGANASKTYTDIMYSYILLQAKYTAVGATTAKFSARRPSEK